MFKFFLFVFVLSLYLSFLTSSADQNDIVKKKPPPRKIAIVGGGIAGSSASFFLREKFGNDVLIDLFEPSSTLCGRVATVNVKGREYESGGSIIHPKNLYMKGFLDAFSDLETANRYKGGTAGFFDGANYLLWTSTWWIVKMFQMFWTFGIDLLRINWLESDFMKDFERIYELQDQGHSYEDVSTLLYAMGGDKFVNASQMTAYELFSSQGISDYTIRNLITPGIRVNYGQNASVNGFVGSVAMAGVQPGLWSVKGGNKLICDRLVSHSKPNIIQEHVTKVIFHPDKEEGKFSVATQESVNLASELDLDKARSYDIVVVTAPIGPGLSGVDLSEACSDVATCPTSNTGEYRTTVATFVRGKLRSTLFHCDSVAECPSTILVTNPTTLFRSVGLHMPVDYDPDKDTLDNAVYKVFSSRPLTQDQLLYLFERFSDKKVVDWKAYPYYHVPDHPPKMALNKAGLYYTSPIEWSASAIEMVVISAKNSVLLAYNNWYRLEDKMNLDLNPNRRGRSVEL